MGEKTLSSAAEGGMAVDLCAGMCQIDTKKKKTYPENVLIRAVLMKFSGINECAVCSTVLLAYESLGVCSEVGFAYKERVMTLLCVLKGIRKCCLLK